MTNRKRVLVLTSTFPRWQGDSEPPFVFELSRRLSEQFDVVVLAPHTPGAKRFEHMGNLEVHRFRYFFARWERLAYQGGILANLKRSRWCYLLLPFFFISQLAALWRILRHQRVDVIHAHWIIPQGVVAVAARMLALRGNKMPAILCTSHGGDLFGLQGTPLTWLKRQVICRVERLTVVSHAMFSYASSLANKQDIDVIPMGVNLIEEFTPDANIVRNTHEILFVGRLVEKKGVAYLVLAMPEILKRCPEAKLVIAGDGPEGNCLRKLAQTTGVVHHIQFLGNVENGLLPELYRRATLFVAPSIVTRGGDQEGLGLVFVEAMGCECPVVATDLAAVRDVVIDGVTGVVCKREDSRDLAHKIVALLCDPVLRQSLGRAGRAHVLERFDWPIVASRYTRLLDDLVSGA